MATQHVLYVNRDSQAAKDDLRGVGAAHLPLWAKDATHFFAMADRYERQKGIVARTYEISLPRELTEEERAHLADDIRSTFWSRHPHSWAIHCPTAHDGHEQPHLHVIVNERLIDGIERGPKAFFARAAPYDDSPASGGARKDLRWNELHRIQELRMGVMTLTNAALERANVDVAVSDLTLKERKHDHTPEEDLGRRSAVLYIKYKDGIPDDLSDERKKAVVENNARWEQLLTARASRRADHPWENVCNLATWEVQKAHEGIRDLDREAMVAHVRDKFWLHDHSPAREQERAESLDRAIAREYARTGRVREGGLERELPPGPPRQRREHDHGTHHHEPERDLDRRWAQPIIGNKHSRIYHLPTHKNYGDVGPHNQVHFRTEREAHAAGYRLARNEYGIGAETPMEARERAAWAPAAWRRRAGRGAAWGRGGEDLAYGGVQVRLEQGMEVER